MVETERKPLSRRKGGKTITEVVKKPEEEERISWFKKKIGAKIKQINQENNPMAGLARTRRFGKDSKDGGLGQGTQAFTKNGVTYKEKNDYQ